MPHYKLLFPNDYVGAWDLERGEKTVEIERITKEKLTMIGGKSEDKPLIYFKGAKKKMVLNKTNAKTIAGLYGTNTEEWVGKKVTLFATTCSGKGGEEVECIRVRPKVPSNGKGKKSEPEQPELGYDPYTGEVAPEDEPPLPGEE